MTRQNNDIDVFFCNDKGNICKCFMNPRVNWDLVNRGEILSANIKGRYFSMIRTKNLISVFYVGEDDKVHSSI